ncbi:MAG: DinB family protein [Planctomycetota bacterium]
MSRALEFSQKEYDAAPRGADVRVGPGEYLVQRARWSFAHAAPPVLFSCMEKVMDSIELIHENLARSEEIVLSRIEEMRGHCMVRSSAKGGGHTLWVLGHLAYIESMVIHHFMLGDANPLGDWEAMFDGAEVSVDAEVYVSFDRALAECRAVRASTTSLLATFDEADLDRVSAKAPQGTESLFGTYRRCFQYSADHWLMHRGQLADARCAAGVNRMWY